MAESVNASILNFLLDSKKKYISNLLQMSYASQKESQKESFVFMSYGLSET